MTDPDPSQPTQVLHPKRTTARTALQIGIPAFVALVLVLPEILRVAVDELGGVLPEGVTLWLAGAAVAVTAAGTALARIMAIPAVNAWLTDYLGGVFAAEPRKP